MRWKGNFSKCEICNNAAYLLRTNTKMPKEQRDIILQYRRIHLKQQLAERIFCEENKLKTATNISADVKPNIFLSIATQ